MHTAAPSAFTWAPLPFRGVRRDGGARSHLRRSVTRIVQPTCNQATKTRRNWVDDGLWNVLKTQPLSTRPHPPIWLCSGSSPVVPAIPQALRRYMSGEMRISSKNPGHRAIPRRRRRRPADRPGPASGRGRAVHVDTNDCAVGCLVRNNTLYDCALRKMRLSRIALSRIAFVARSLFCQA